MNNYMIFYRKHKNGKLVDVGQFPKAYKKRGKAEKVVERFFTEAHDIDESYDFIIAKDNPFTETGEVVTVPMTVYVKGTPFWKEDAEERSIIELEFPTWIVREWFENIVLARAKDDPRFVSVDFETWLGLHIPDGTNGLYGYARTYGYKAEESAPQKTDYQEPPVVTMENFRALMAEKGFTKAQAESRAVAAALDILTNSKGYDFTRVYEIRHSLEKKLEEKDDTLKAEKRALDEKEARLNEMEAALNKKKEDAEAEIAMRAKAAYDELFSKADETVKYIRDFNASLEECETPESRDAMRRAQIFRNTIVVKTERENMVYITCLGKLLSEIVPARTGMIAKTNAEGIRTGFINNENVQVLKRKAED